MTTQTETNKADDKEYNEVCDYLYNLMSDSIDTLESLDFTANNDYTKEA